MTLTSVRRHDVNVTFLSMTSNATILFKSAVYRNHSLAILIYPTKHRSKIEIKFATKKKAEAEQTCVCFCLQTIILRQTERNY